MTSILEKLESGGEEYKAFQTEGNQNFLEFMFRGGDIEMLSYAYLSGFQFIENDLIMTFSDITVNIQGYHLKEIRHYLQDQRVRSIKECPQNYQRDEKEIVVENIKIYHPNEEEDAN